MNTILENNKQWIDETWQKIEEKLRRTSVELKDKIPKVTTNGVYDDLSKSPGAWTNGFWPGIMWLMYDATGEECFKIAAENVEEKLDGALENFNVLHHDVGFMWLLSSGANYLLTGNKKSKNRNLHAAAALASRYNVDGGFIKAWNDKGADGWVIIDCMMNIPLLYWAAKETNNVAYSKIADKHAEKTMKHHIRPDGSVYHVVEYDITTEDANGVLIGKNSQTLAALQFITSLIVNQYFDRETESGLIVKVDVGGYRKRREGNLERLAVEYGKQVAKSKQSVTLDGLNSYERKIIHDRLSTWNDLRTHSEGEEPNRFLIIEYVGK